MKSVEFQYWDEAAINCRQSNPMKQLYCKVRNTGTSTTVYRNPNIGILDR